MFDLQGRYLYANPTGAHHIGLEPRDMIGRHWRELNLPAPIMERFDADRDRVAETGRPVSAMTEFPTVEGVRDYEYVITPVIDEAGRVEATVATATDITARKRAETALRASEERFRQAVLAAPYPIMIHAEDGEVLQINEEWSRLTGYVLEDMPTVQEWIDRCCPERSDEIRAELTRVYVADTRSKNAELEITTRTGEQRIWEFNSAPLGAAPDGRKIVISMAVDVTDRRRTEEALRAGERRFRTIFETSAIGISLADLHGRLVNSNPALQAMLGYTRNELIGVAFPKVTHPADVAVSLRYFRELATGVRDTYQIEKRYSRKDGAVVWGLLTASLVRDAEGVPQYVVGMVEDITERKHAEAALRESEQRFRAVFEHAGIGIVLADTEGRFLTANRAFQSLVGYSQDELPGMRFTQIVYPDDIDRDWRLYQELRAGKRDSYQVEKRYLRSDGRVVWVRLTASSVRDEDGRYRYGIGMVEDITERREAAEAQRRLQAILEATPDFVGIADARARVLYVNRAGRDMTGIGPEEDISILTIADFHPAWAVTVVLDEAVPAAVRDGVWRGETALLGPNGKEIPTSQVVIAHTDPAGNIEYLSTIARDITDQKRLEESQRFLAEAGRALAGSLEFDGILQNLTELLVPELADACVIDIITEPHGARRVAAAHSDPDKQALIERLRGFPPVQPTPAGIAAVLASGKPELVTDVDDQWLRAATMNAEHYAALRELAPRSVIIVPLVVRGGVMGAIAMASTHPERRYGPDELGLAMELASRAALALENARLYAEAREATRIRDDVLAVVSHDLRNPLNTISLAAGLLREQSGALEESQRKQLDIIDRATRRADRLIHDLLDVARMEVGRLTVAAGRTNTVGVLTEVLESYRTQANAKDQTITGHWSKTLPDIWADRDRLVQILGNLLANAVKFTPEGGRIDLKAVEQDRAVRFSVSDNGPGISPEQLQRLFDPFWQAARGEGKGAGLGLAISRGLVEAHGGQIWAESQVGAGTTVSFTIPTVNAARERRARTGHEISPDRSPRGEADRTPHPAASHQDSDLPRNQDPRHEDSSG